MALSRELTRRLHTNQEPLAKRLKLAENTFTTEDFPVTRKEELVLKWLCEQIEKEEKNCAPVLSTLAKCLKFKNSCPTVILKTDVKQILVDTLEAKLSHARKADLRSVVESCKMIFSSREMYRYFEENVASLARLISALVDCIHDEKPGEVMDDDESPLKEEARNCVIDGIECLVTCYKQSANKNEMAEVLVSQILYPLCSLVDVNQSDKLGAEIYKCVQQLIFGKTRYSQFKDFVEKDGKDDFVGKLFAGLSKKAESSKEDVTVVVFLYVFRAASGSYKNDPATIDRVFRKLMDSAGPVKVKVLAAVQQQLANVGFDYQNKIEECTLFEYFQKLIDEVISTEEINAFHYEALETIAVLNPLIVETKMENILKRILLKEKKTDGEIDSYRKLMVAIVQAGVRLRREQKLIPWILKAMEEELESSENSKFDVAAIFPVDFKIQFSQSVGNMTSMQTIGILRTLNFHLNNCVESIAKNKRIGTVMLQATVDLLSAYFEGVRIFDHSIPVSGQDKFVQGLKDLGKTIFLVTEEIMKIKGNKKMMTAVLTAVWYWDNMHTWIKYYVPEALPQELDFPISESQVQGIMENIDHFSCKNAMNRILVQKIGRNLERDNSLTLSKLLGGLENAWSIILDQSPQIIATMNNFQIAESAKLFLDDLKSRNLENSQSMKRLHAESVQNDERFLKALAYQILVDISQGISDSMTKRITGHVNVVKILNRGSLSKLMKEMKSDLTRKEWQTLEEESTFVVEKDLEILLHLPLKYFALDVRTILLLVVYSIKNECKGNEKILQICGEVTMDLSEKLDIDVMDVLDPDSLIHELTHDKSFQRVIESSLKNLSNWETLKSLIKKCRTGDDSAALLLECIERVRPKLKSEGKEIFKKAEKKLSNKLQENLNGALKDHISIRRLTLALAVATTHGQIPDILMATTKSTLNAIFVTDGSKDEELVVDGLRLVNVVLKLPGKLEFNDEIVNNVWPHVLNNPIKEMALRLLERTEPKALQKLFSLLHSKTSAALGESDEVSFKRCLIVWDCVTSIQMGGARQKLRTAALHDLLKALQISKIPVNFWPDVLKLVHSTLAESLHVLEKSIDVVSLLADRSLNEAELIACEHVLVLCSALVKFNAPMITDRLPILLGLYRKIVRIVVRESRKENDSSRLRILGCLAIDIEKLTNCLVKLKKDLARISPYVIADLVGIFSEGVIPPKVKGPLEDSVGHFLSISDHHAISLLSRTLPTSTRGIFQTLYETYNKYHKFTGKI